MSRSSSLHRLQEVDLALDRTHAALQEIQKTLEEQSDLQRARDALTAAEVLLQGCRTANSSAEDAASSQHSKIEDTDKKLYGGSIRNPKELEDLQQESESLKRHLATLDDRLLESMVALEEAELAHATASQAVADAEQDRAQLEQELSEKRTQHLAEVERLQTEREGAVASVAEKDLSLYEKLRRSKAGLAVSLLDGECCRACGMAIPPAKRQTVHSMTELLLCTQCGRILHAG